MPDYTGTYRWLNPATHAFEPVTVRGRWNLTSVDALTYRDLYYSPTPVPDPPIIVTARMDTQTQSTIEWQDGYNTGNVIYYTVRRGGTDVSGALDPSVQTFIETGLPTAIPNPIFNYTVEAQTDQGLSLPSDIFPVQWQTPPATRRPFPPTNTRINLATVTEVSGDVLWDMSTDPSVTGFRVYRNGVPGIPLADLVDPTARTFHITGLSPATTYSGINVRAYNSVGESGASNFTSFTTVDPAGFVSRFPGHQAGLVYLGVYSANAYGTEDTAIGTVTALERIIDSGVTGTVTQHVTGYQNKIDLATLDSKMAWISLQPAHLGLSGTDTANWGSISSGGVDTALQQYFDLIGELVADFVMFTFQPMYNWSALTDITAGQYCDAINYIGDAWASYNQKANGIYGPIIGSDYYQAVQAAQRAPGQFINDNLLDTSEFLGIDIYQDNKTPQPASAASARLNYIIGQYQTLTSHDTIMMALGEVAGANVFRLGGLYKGVTIPASSASPTGSQWLQDALGYVFSNRDRFFAVSAFDTSGQTSSPKWALDETSVTSGSGTLDTVTKMAVYQAAINGSQIARQQGETVKKTLSATATLDRPSYTSGNSMTLTVTENATSTRTIVVTDTTVPAVTWTKQSDNGTTAVYTATAPSTANTARTVSVKVTRNFDNKSTTATATYAVTTVVVASPFLMGTSIPDSGKSVTQYPPSDSGFNQWDAIRCYDFTDVNRQLAYNPKTIGLTDKGTAIHGGATSATALQNFLISFYEGGGTYTFSNMTLAQRQQVEIHFANGNEYGNNVTNATTFVATIQAMYNVIHQSGWSRFPKASMWLDPTHNQEQSELTKGTPGSGAPSLTITLDGRYLDGIAWSMYPPGRESTSPDPTYTMPTFVEADKANNQKGFLYRCWARTRDQSIAAGKGSNGLWISTWEIGIGDDPNDRTHRPWYVCHQLAGGAARLNTQFNMTMKIMMWWNQQVADNAGVIQSENPFNAEATNTTPSTATVWRNWRQYNHNYGGTHPAAWTSNPQKTNTANPQSSWKRNGDTVLA